MRVLSLFDGMACGHVALERAGIKPSLYYAAEVDKYAMAIAKKNHPWIIHMGDVTRWREWGIDWSKIDLLIGGSPCQSFSLQGKQMAFDDPRGKLFFVYLDILVHIKRLNPDVRFLLENVNMAPANRDAFSFHLGVDPVNINSKEVVCQSRSRWYWFNWKYTEVECQVIPFNKIIDGAEGGGWFPATVRKGNPRPVISTGDIFTCLTATYYKGIRADGRPALARRLGDFDELQKVGDVKMLTPLECERLQTVPDNYTEGVSNTQRYKMLGNGWTVDVVAHIFRSMLRC